MHFLLPHFLAKQIFSPSAQCFSHGNISRLHRALGTPLVPQAQARKGPTLRHAGDLILHFHPQSSDLWFIDMLNSTWRYDMYVHSLFFAQHHRSEDLREGVVSPSINSSENLIITDYGCGWVFRVLCPSFPKLISPPPFQVRKRKLDRQSGQVFLRLGSATCCRRRRKFCCQRRRKNNRGGAQSPN